MFARLHPKKMHELKAQSLNLQSNNVNDMVILLITRSKKATDYGDASTLMLQRELRNPISGDQLKDLFASLVSCGPKCSNAGGLLKAHFRSDLFEAEFKYRSVLTSKIENRRAIHNLWKITLSSGEL